MTLFLTFLLSVAPLDGGVKFSDALYSICPQAGPATRTLSGDWIMPHERAERLACLIETCEARRLQFEVREKEQGAPAAWWAIVLVAVSSAVGGLDRKSVV